MERSLATVALRTARRHYATHAADDRFVTVLECGPRDGLQNEKGSISTATKVELIKQLVDTGLRFLDVGAFVSPKWVPSMADTAKVLRLIPKGPRYAVLTPNVKAVDDIVKTGSLEFIHEVFVFGAASEGFSRANTNCSVAESIDRMAATTERALAHGLKVRGSVSCIVGSPFESSVDKKLVREIAQKMIQAGCYGVSLADTIGVGNPATIRAVIEEVMKEVPASKLGIHCHDTFGSGIANTLTAVDAGIRVVDASVAGLGGCPYAPGATGNISTEDIVYALHGMGYQTGVDVDKLAKVGGWISEQLHKSNISRAGAGLLAKAKRLEASAAQ